MPNAGRTVQRIVFSSSGFTGTRNSIVCAFVFTNGSDLFSDGTGPGMQSLPAAPG